VDTGKLSESGINVVLGAGVYILEVNDGQKNAIKDTNNHGRR
jgi:hypothetical protein